MAPRVGYYTDSAAARGMERVAIVAITRGGLATARRISPLHPSWEIHAPSKLDDGQGGVSWFGEPTPERVGSLFASTEALVCIFSLGAVIRLVAPHLRGKKSDPAIVVVDDAGGFAISALSGHLGGANALARDIAAGIGAVPVITTAADVTGTIAVDMVGRDRGWRIDGDGHVTRVSAMMVNGEAIGVWQGAGDRGALAGGPLPPNVTAYASMGELRRSGCAGALVVSDTLDEPPPMPAVVYRPRSLVVGVGVHRDTPAAKILECLGGALRGASLSPMCVARLASVKKPAGVEGLAEAARSLGVELELVDRAELAAAGAPNPSRVVERLEGTPSVSEAAAIVASRGGALVVQKQKYPPDLTLAVARVAQ